MSAPAVTDPVKGYYRPKWYRWITMPRDLWSPKERPEPLGVFLRANLTFAQMAAIPYGEGVRYADIEAAIAPHILRWNVTAINAQNGKREPVPPPAEVGPNAMRLLSEIELEWLAIQLRAPAGLDVAANDEHEEEGVA